MLELKETINTMVDQLRSFAAEVTRVAREVGTEGMLGGQARVEGVSGVWKDLTDNVNFMASNLTDQVRNIAEVTTAVAQGDLGRKITVDVKGEILAAQEHDQHDGRPAPSFADEVTRVAREVGTEGKLGGQARVKGVSGTWKDLTDSRQHARRQPDRPGAQHRRRHDRRRAGDLSQKITVDARGEVAAAQEHDQHDGRPALVLRRRGDARREGGRHRGPARRPGPGARASPASGATSRTTSTRWPRR